MSAQRLSTLATFALLAALGCGTCAPLPTGEGEGEGASGEGEGEGEGASAEGEGEGAGGEGEGEGGDACADLRARLLDAVAACTPIGGVTPYATDSGEPATVLPCAIPGAIVWQSDLDVDCDGGQQTTCTSDPSYLPETSATTQAGAPIDANAVPFFVVPLPGHGFDYGAQGIPIGAAGFVIFGNTLVAGVFADEGPPDIIGEASYAMAEALGIDPDPVTGGADSGATFVVFTGDSAVSPIEDHTAATARATTLARAALGCP